MKPGPPVPVSILVACILSSSALAAEATHARLDEKHRTFLRDYCLTCHNAEKQKGKVRLDDIAFTLDSVEKADLWQKVLNSINSGEMPPEDEKQPDAAAKTDFLDDLSRTLVTARAALSDSGGKITMRRLNRREYKNTIRDLLGVDINVRELPADGGAGTFDTVGSSLFMSSDQFEQYLALGRLALDEHFARFIAPSGAKPRLMHVEAEERNARIVKSLAERTDAHQRYEKWTAAVSAAAQQSGNAAVAAQIRAEKKNDATYFYSQWQRIQGAPSPKEFGFTDAVNADEDGRRNWVHSVPHQKAYVEHPATKTGSFLTIEDVFANPYQPFRIPGDWPAGDYVVRVRIAATGNTPKERHFVEFGPQHDSGVRAVASSHQVTGTMEQPQVLEIPLKFSPAKGHGFFFQEKGSYESEEVAHRLFAEAKQRNGIGPEFALWIDWIEVVSSASQTFKTRIETEVAANKEITALRDRLKKDHDRYVQWTTAVDAEAAKPENAALVKELREHPQVKSNAELFYIHWEKHRDNPSSKQFGYKEAGDARFYGKTQFDRLHRYFSEYLTMPNQGSGSYLLTYQGHEFEKITVDPKWPAGTYTLRVRLAALDDAPAERRFIQFGQHGEQISMFTVMGTYQITGTMAQPQTLEIPVMVTSTGKREFVIREKQASDRATLGNIWYEAWNKTGTGPKPALWLDWLEIEGPSAPVASSSTPQIFKTHVEPEIRANKQTTSALDALRQDHKRYLQWAAAIDAEAAKPENAALAGELRKLPAVKADASLFYMEWAKKQKEPGLQAFGFPNSAVPADARNSKYQYDIRHRDYEDYLAMPHKDTGAYLSYLNGHTEEVVQIHAKWPAGHYTVRLRVAAADDAPKDRRFIEFGQPGSGGFGGGMIVKSSHQITGTMASPQILEIPVTVPATGGRDYLIREKKPNSNPGLSAVWWESLKKQGAGPKPALWIDWIEVESAAGAKPPSITATTPQPQKLRKDPEQWANKYMPIYAQGYAEKYSRFQKWCAAIDEAAKKPEHAAEIAKLRADPRLKTQPHLFYSGFAKLKDAPQPTQFGFKDVDDAQFARSEFTYHHQYYLDYAKLPARDNGSWLMLYSLGRYTGITAPDKWPAGKYTLRVRLAASDESPKERRFIEIGTGKADAADFNVLSSHQVTGTLANPQTLEIPVEINASGDRNFAIRDKRPNKREAEYAMFREAWDKTGTGPRPCIWVDFVELEGPVNDAPALTKTIIQRREVELHANAMVGGTYNGYFKGGYEAAKKFMETKQAQKGIPDEQEAKFRIHSFEEHGPSFERYLADPLTKTGSLLTIFQVHTEEVITLPPDHPSGWLKTKHEIEKAEPGDYLLRFRIGAIKGTPKERHFVAFGSRMKPEEREDFTLMHTFQISGTTDAPQTIEVPVSISANGPRTFVLREKRDVKRDFDLYQAARKETKVGPPSALWIDWVEWEGPIVKQAPIARVERIEPEKRRADVERGHLRFQYLNEQYAKWKAAGGDEKRLKEFDFTDKSHAEFAKYVWEQNNRWFQQYLDRPLSKTGLYLDNTVQETCEHVIDLPADLATGDYVMRVKIGRVPDMPTERAFLSFVEASPIDKDDRTFLANKQITSTLDQPEIVELPFQIRPGGPRKFILMEKRPLKKEAISLPGRTRQIADAKQRDPVLWIDWIEWEGPLNKVEADSQMQPVIAAEETNARNVLEKFAKRAFRGKKPSAAFLDKLTALYELRRKAGDAHETALKEPLSVILASPGFLYLHEIGTGSEDNQNMRQSDKEKASASSSPRRTVSVSPAELASRLSYFLWSAPPDDQLLTADLSKPELLAREVDRLIASPKADQFVSGFVHQWLDMDRLDFFQFDTRQFRDFDESAKAAARREVYETFAHLLCNNGSLTKLLKSDEIHVNGLLATYYGIEGISGDAFQKVKLPANSPRGGLLGMAAILAMGSNGERTSPVERGAWVLRKLLHNPPPPAPPNVPQLTRLENKLLNTRERLLAHQEEPQCAQCHRKIDPIGFGLENFNAAGKWRTEETYEKRGVGKKTWPIDPGGQFHNGPAFKDYFELRDLIAAKDGDFARGFTEALIEYALGRPFSFADEVLATDIVVKAKAKEFVIREFIVALATSREFRTK